MIREYVNFQTFFNPENWLAEFFLLFPCLVSIFEGGGIGQRKDEKLQCAAIPLCLSVISKSVVGP